MAELADAHGSGPCGSNTMRVQVSFPALIWKSFRSDPEASFIIKSSKKYRHYFYTPYKIDIVSLATEEKWNTQEK